MEFHLNINKISIWLFDGSFMYVHSCVYRWSLSTKSLEVSWRKTTTAIFIYPATRTRRAFWKIRNTLYRRTQLAVITSKENSMKSFGYRLLNIMPPAWKLLRVSTLPLIAMQSFWYGMAISQWTNLLPAEKYVPSPCKVYYLVTFLLRYWSNITSLLKELR